MSKSKLAPKNRVTVPRMELCGAVLSKRICEFIIEYTQVTFRKIYHLVDASTVLGYLHKEDGRLMPFEGIRVSEIQSAGTFIDGRLEGREDGLSRVPLNESGHILMVCYVNIVLHAPCYCGSVIVSVSAIIKTSLATSSRDTTTS